MSSIRNNNGLLFFDFRYQGHRCREYTKLADTAANRKTMQKVLDKIEAEITLGTFDYGRYFQGSKNAARFQVTNGSNAQSSSTPIYKVFVETWYEENLPLWRRSHAATIRSTLDKHIVPWFGNTEIGNTTKADVLQFRAELAKLPGRGGNSTLSPKTINRIVQILGQILEEAADRYEFNNPATKIKRLKQPRSDIHPFSLEQVRLLIASIRKDYKNYLTVRFFTGLRTGELNGLKWKYVDFERRQILVRETIVRGLNEYTKTDGSQREVDMCQPVYEALKAQKDSARDISEYVFCNAEGEPIDVDNFTNRVWYPLLRHLGLEKRRPYQTRHTAATLWLAAGENPEWVARQLGHVNTIMLFKVYSRFIPNLTRQDGSAFDRIITGAMTQPMEVQHGH